MIRKKPRTNPDKANTGNKYLDAAIEALRKAHEEDKDFNYALFTESVTEGRCLCEGSMPRIAAAMSKLASDHEEVRELFDLTHDGIAILDKGESFLQDMVETVKAARNDVQKMNNELKKLLNESRRKK